MKVTLLGATGFVGSTLLKEALNRGPIVTAIVRHPERLEKREGLTAKAGEVYDTTSLATLIQGNDAIIDYQRFQSWVEEPEPLRRPGSGEQRPSSPRLRRRESKGCSGWAGRVGWRSNLESASSIAQTSRVG